MSSKTIGKYKYVKYKYVKKQTNKQKHVVKWCDESAHLE